MSEPVFTCSLPEAEPDYRECEQCGGTGYCGHECGEDTCNCPEPEENEVCDVCDGLGYSEWSKQ